MSLAVAAAAFGRSLPVRAAETAEALQHGFSPLGELKYPPGFAAFDYVNPDAPKGGTLRLARTGAFDTIDTLHYPGRPPADIRLIYDRLVVASDDETAGFYGLLAQGVVVSDDYAEIAFELDPAARWHDGQRLTAEDVLFTFETLKSEGAPFYRQAFRSISAVAQADDRVVFTNSRPGDRDAVSRIATIPVHPAHVWKGAEDISDANQLVGSGPYRVAQVDAPRGLILERVPDYWAAELGVNTGRWNFDWLAIDYYRDADVALEAFKADDYDIRFEDSPSRWQNGYAGPALSAGSVQRAEGAVQGVGTLHGIVFNLRRPHLPRRNLRLALMLAYDFKEVNRSLFGGAYDPFVSVFGDTELAADGPAGPEERSVLEAGGASVPEHLLMSPDPLDASPPPGSRDALRKATRLLDEAGYAVVDGRRTDPTTGEPLVFELVSSNPLYDRVLTWVERGWSRLGIGVTRALADPTSASRRLLDRDFDLATLSWSPRRLPGTAERLLWHSDLATRRGSYALSGLESPLLDATISALGSARSPDALTAAGRAFDRAFRHAAPMLPLFRESRSRLAWWDRFGRPEAEVQGLAPSPTDRWWRTG